MPPTDRTPDAEHLRVLREMRAMRKRRLRWLDAEVPDSGIRAQWQREIDALTEAIKRWERLLEIERERDAYKKYWDRFAEWAQEALDAGRWAGHPLDDAVRVELTEARERLAGLREKVEKLPGFAYQNDGRLIYRAAVLALMWETEP